MKKWVLVLLAICSSVMMACKKDASQFQGMVRYVDSLGAYHAADSALITVHNKDTSAPAEVMGYTDVEGIYLLSDVPDGIWVVRAVLEIDSNTSYLGVSKKMECYGKDFVAVPIDMVEE